MAYTVAQLRALSDADLIREHDHVAQSTSLGLNYFRDELNRREQDAQTRIMLKLTRVITWMTGVILVLTIVNTILVWFALPPRPSNQPSPVVKGGAPPRTSVEAPRESVGATKAKGTAKSPK